eukprot:g226.t1
MNNRSFVVIEDNKALYHQKKTNQLGKKPSNSTGTTKQPTTLAKLQKQYENRKILRGADYYCAFTELVFQKLYHMWMIIELDNGNGNVGTILRIENNGSSQKDPTSQITIRQLHPNEKRNVYHDDEGKMFRSWTARGDFFFADILTKLKEISDENYKLAQQDCQNLLKEVHRIGKEYEVKVESGAQDVSKVANSELQRALATLLHHGEKKEGKNAKVSKGEDSFCMIL